MGKPVVHEETICCNSKRCPVLRVFEDGSIEVRDDDVQGESVGVVKFNREQSLLLAARIMEKNG